HWYAHTLTFDGADRPVSASTGIDRDVPELLDPTGSSAVSMTYSKRGAIAGVSSGYGPLVRSVTRAADGMITQIVYGDRASTTSNGGYDARRRLSTAQTYRGTPAIWQNPPISYVPPPLNAPDAPPSTLELLLEDADYAYDVADNPVAIRDFRNPDEWPSG